MCYIRTYMSRTHEIRSTLFRACRHLLTPLIRVLLRSGIHWSEFAELCKEVYVAVARDEYGLGGRPTNTARVAMITGLSRREAARVRSVIEGRDEPSLPPEDRISRVLTGWHLDPDFLDERGEPRVLEDSGSASVGGLFKRYAGDVPHGALLKELIQLGLVERTPTNAYRVKARDYVRSAQDPDIVRQMGVALHDHGTTLAHNVDNERTGPARFEGMATNMAVASEHVEAFHELVAERGQALLEEIDEWLSQHETKHAPQATSPRLGVGVYLIHDDTEKGRKT